MEPSWSSHSDSLPGVDSHQNALIPRESEALLVGVESSPVNTEAGTNH